MDVIIPYNLAFWHCHPYFILQFYSNIFILVIVYYVITVIVVFLYFDVYKSCISILKFNNIASEIYKLTSLSQANSMHIQIR